jgi:hypothetical protein
MEDRLIDALIGTGPLGALLGLAFWKLFSVLACIDKRLLRVEIQMEIQNKESKSVA